MKRFFKSLVLIAFIASSCIPAWSQSSTQGKEFWVALIPSRSPDGESPSSNGFDSYIAISAPKKCAVRVSNPQTGWSNTYQIANDNAWLEIKDIPLDQWYSTSMPASERELDKGLKVEATEEVSVYSCLRWNYSMDATNILPVTALQSEYIVQTYGPSNKDGIKKNVFSVLAVEDCKVDITLAAQTEGGKTGSIQGLSLKAGQVYHVKSAEGASLNGSRILAKDGKKIAVFAGCPLGNIPDNVSDRDLVYEQLFPIDYWGQNFVVVRSKEKDANRVIITAQEDNTTVTIYGNYDPSAAKNGDHTIKQNYSFELKSGQSYEFEMSAGYENGRWDSKREVFSGITILDSTAYIKASCPCAVLSYDVGNGYYRKDAGIETYHTKKPGDDKESYWGAPAMTWIAPIEQMMNEVVFGVMGTTKTDRHFVNIIVPKAGVSEATMMDKPLASFFRPVESNPDYYYARISLPHTVSGTPNPFYQLKCKHGFIATVYGNGDDESYAYTVGSSTIKRGVEVGGQRFIDQDWGDEPFCIDDELTFNPQIGTDVIDKVVWDFGDGTTATTTREEGIEAKHVYSTPNWYTVEARISAHKDCPATTYPEETVTFTFRIVRPDTVVAGAMHECFTPEEYAADPHYCDSLMEFGSDSVVQKACWDTVYIYRVVYGLETEETLPDFEGRDSIEVFGKMYYSDTVVVDTLLNDAFCNHYRKYRVSVITCLGMDVSNNIGQQHACPGKEVEVSYTKTKGTIASARFVVPGLIDEAVTIPNDNHLSPVSLSLPTYSIEKAGRYHGALVVDDYYCDSLVFPVDFDIYYPKDIFKYKFNNVLAVYKKGTENNQYYDLADYTFQWYLNGEAIEGANQSVYHHGDSFEINDEVYVVFIDKSGFALPSCSQIIDKTPDYHPATTQAPAQKIMRNNRIVIRMGDKTYDVYGQRVE